MNKILLFLDLDDTLFQTQRKKPQGSIPATHNVSTLSYMTEAQQALWQLFHEHPHALIIPVTARDQRQYHNTFLSQEAKIQTAVLYFSGLILHQGQPDPHWQAHIKTAYDALDTSIEQLYQQLQKNLSTQEHSQFNTSCSDHYYVTIKAQQDCPKALRDSVFQRIRGLLPQGYFVHENDRALSLLPKCLDKRHAVEYLIEQHQPTLTLGAGDSLTDWGFMQACDFRLIPKQTQLDTALSD